MMNEDGEANPDNDEDDHDIQGNGLTVVMTTTGHTNVYGSAKWGGASGGGATKVYLPMLLKR